MTIDVREYPRIPPFAYQGRDRSEAIPPCQLGRKDLRRLRRDLAVLAAEALEVVLGELDPLPGETEEQLDVRKQYLRERGELAAILVGRDGDRDVGTRAEALSEERWPAQLTSVTFDSGASMQTPQFTMPNKFRVHLDFSEPPVFFGHNPWEDPTPNTSWFEVSGPDKTWVGGVVDTVQTFFKNKRKNRKWLHSPVFFNYLHWLVSLPAALWLVYRLDQALEEASVTMHGALRGAIYVYVVLAALVLSRLLVGWARRVFPPVELDGAKSGVVRAALWTVVVGVVGSLIANVLWALKLWPFTQ